LVLGPASAFTEWAFEHTWALSHSICQPLLETFYFPQCPVVASRQACDVALSSRVCKDLVGKVDEGQMGAVANVDFLTIRFKLWIFQEEQKNLDFLKREI
jgi:hypothetical protein